MRWHLRSSGTGGSARARRWTLSPSSKLTGTSGYSRKRAKRTDYRLCAIPSEQPGWPQLQLNSIVSPAS